MIHRRGIWRVSALAAVLGALPLLAGCDRRSEAASEKNDNPAVVVTVQPAELRTVQRSVEVVGTLYGNEETTISAKVAGRIANIYKDMGDRVEPGAALAQIEPKDYQLAVNQKSLAVREQLAKLGLTQFPDELFDVTQVPTVRKARLQADNAEAKYKRGKQLHDQKPPLISDQDFADLQTAWEVAKSSYDVEVLTAKSLLDEARSREADLEIERQLLADTVIRAPENVGQATTIPATAAANAVQEPQRTYAIAARLTSVGEYVKEGTALFKLIDDNPLKLRGAVPERFIGDIAIGQAVKLKVEAYPQEFDGVVTRINPQVDPANRTFQIEALIANSKRLLKSGSFARAQVLTRRDNNVLFVPQEAVVSFAGTNKVFTVDQDKAAEHIVQMGEFDQGMVEITKGLQGQVSVVVDGATKLADGVAVRLRSTQAGATQPTDAAQ